MTSKLVVFPELRNDLILRAARGEAVERVPIWLHRQAGRYLKSFRDVREEHDFFTICRTPELACLVTMQPIDKYDLDAAIIFSDILVVPQAMGLQVQMIKGVGPLLPKPIREPSDMERLKRPDVSTELQYVYDAITLTRVKLGGKVPLIGFVGAPWTLMCYMVEGRGAKSFYAAKRWLYQYPEAAHELLQRITDVCVEFLIGQVIAGAQMLEVFDSWAGDLSPRVFAEFELKYLKQIATRVKQGLRDRHIAPVPMTVFPKGAHYALEALADSDFDVISLDWTMDAATARKRVGDKVSFQGNLEPAVLYAGEKVIREHCDRMVQEFGTRGYIANLGHGMLPTHSESSVAIVVQSVHECSEALIAHDKP